MNVITPAEKQTTTDLIDRARAFADAPREWLSQVRLSADGRWYERVHADWYHDVWLIGWLPGQSTGFHDHGESSGAFAVAFGSLEEHDMSGARTVPVGQVRGFGPGYVHDVRNVASGLAVSVHVYSPPLAVMNRYELIGSGLARLGREDAEAW